MTDLKSVDSNIVGVRSSLPVPHLVDFHYSSDGELYCHTCRGKLKGTFLRPLIPWQHKDEVLNLRDETEIAGLDTTE